MLMVALGGSYVGYIYSCDELIDQFVAAQVPFSHGFELFRIQTCPNRPPRQDIYPLKEIPFFHRKTTPEMDMPYEKHPNSPASVEEFQPLTGPDKVLAWCRVSLAHPTAYRTSARIAALRRSAAEVRDVRFHSKWEGLAGNLSAQMA